MAVCQPLLYSRLPVMPMRSARCFELRDFVEGLLHFAFGADDADEVLHRVLQIVLDLVGVFAGGAALEGCERGGGGGLELLVRRCAGALLALANSAA